MLFRLSHVLSELRYLKHETVQFGLDLSTIYFLSQSFDQYVSVTSGQDMKCKNTVGLLAANALLGIVS